MATSNFDISTIIDRTPYQSESDLKQFMTDRGIDSAIWDDWL